MAKPVADLTEIRMRQELERQRNAIDQQVADLMALKTDLRSKFDPTPADKRLLITYQERIDDLGDLKAEIGAAFLEALARQIGLDDLIKQLDELSGAMEKEASRMEIGTKAIGATDRILSIGKKAIESLTKKAKKLVPIEN